ncbi:hypothetical protein PO124_34805 [Bacillus licheniformis]|nr:hypothetical protein [Bacillus licheniformis]
MGTYEPLSKKGKQISNLLAELQINSYTDHLAMSSVKISNYSIFPVMYKEETLSFNKQI